TARRKRSGRREVRYECRVRDASLMGEPRVMQEEMTSEFAHHCARRTAEGDSIPVVQGEEKKASLEPVAMGRSLPEKSPFLWRSINPEGQLHTALLKPRRCCRPEHPTDASGSISVRIAHSATGPTDGRCSGAPRTS